MAFDLRGTDVIVTRADEEHEDPAIVAFMTLLEDDIKSGKHLNTLPDNIAKAMLANLNPIANLDEDIIGEVAL